MDQGREKLSVVNMIKTKRNEISVEIKKCSIGQINKETEEEYFYCTYDIHEQN